MLAKPDTCKGCKDSYKAGLLDGEGHITVSNRPNGRGASVQVGMTNTNLELLKPFLIYGGNIGKPRIRGYGHKKQYDWTVTSSDAVTAINAMLPYLIRLKEKAKIALKIIAATPKKGKHLSDKQAEIIFRARKEFYVT